MTAVGYWQTKDKRTVRIREMTDAHLTNAIAMIERKEKAIENAPHTGGSYYDQASALADAYADDFFRTEAFETLEAKKQELRAELTARRSR